jgi:copper chaperone NosL
MPLRVLCVIICMMLLANCQEQALEPVALSPEDMCDYCKMAISEKRYAAELIDIEGQAFKFDDIGCMTNFVRRSSPKAWAYFVMDFDERQWIRAEDAYYIRSSEFTTPMNGSIVAFKNESRARQAAGEYHGKIVHFNEVLR